MSGGAEPKRPVLGAEGGGGGAFLSDQASHGGSPSDDDLRAAEWERRLAAGDLPEDFLSVTEPKTERTHLLPNQQAGGARSNGGGAGGALTNPAFEPSITDDLIDLPPAKAVDEATAHASRGSVHSPTPSAGSGGGALPPSQTGAAPKTKALLSTEEQDHAMAMALQEQLNLEANESAAAGGGFFNAAPIPAQTMAAPANMVGRLTVTIVEAKLAKNYGMSRMDPYCRVRVGHSVYETPTCANGSKEPKWNKTFTCFLLQGIKNMDIEIYDECTFSQDSLIAHGSFPIPKEVLTNHEVADEWLNLSGSEGEGKEGILHIILSLQPIAPGAPMAAAGNPRGVAPSVSAGHRAMSYQIAPVSAQQLPHPQQQQQPPPPPQLSDEEQEEFLKMFPNLDKEIILSVFAACKGDKDAMVNNLLQMSQE